MMKRLFILISMVLVSLYMVITSVDHREEILFGNYPSVDVTGMVINQPVASREEVTEALSHLAVEHNSLIARRIVEPNEAGETRFIYATYGEGELPEGLTISSKESSETSDLLGSYLIVSGSLGGGGLKSGLFIISQKPSNSTVLRLRNQFLIISSVCSGSLYRAISVNEI